MPECACACVCACMRWWSNFLPGTVSAVKVQGSSSLTPNPGESESFYLKGTGGYETQLI